MRRKLARLSILRLTVLQWSAILRVGCHVATASSRSLVETSCVWCAGLAVHVVQLTKTDIGIVEWMCLVIGLVLISRADVGWQEDDQEGRYVKQSRRQDELWQSC